MCVRKEALIRSTCIISKCGNYRYFLRRKWDGDGPLGVFVALNPSWADEIVCDTTVCKCTNLAIQWEWRGFEIVNLFAPRTENPKELKTHPDPFGPENRKHLLNSICNGDRVVLAWGNGWRRHIRQMLKHFPKRKYHCLSENTGGGYRHPARIKPEDYPKPIPTDPFKHYS